MALTVAVPGEAKLRQVAGRAITLRAAVDPREDAEVVGPTKGAMQPAFARGMGLGRRLQVRQLQCCWCCCCSPDPVGGAPLLRHEVVLHELILFKAVVTRQLPRSERHARDA
jgi:hypothetical protein